MAKHIITSNTSQPLNITGSGNTWIIATSASVITAQSFHETALSDAKGAHDNKIIVNGAVIGGAAGDDDSIVVGGRNTDVIIGALGVIQGDTGIHAEGKHQSVTSHGAITAGWLGISTDHGGVVVNDGSIDAATGIWSSDGHVKIVNKLGGEIVVGDTAIRIEGVGASSRIVNHGTLDAYYYAIDGGDGADIVTNRGTIKGTISLGAGDDVFDNRGGSVDHDIATDIGNDTLITDDASVVMSESANGGNDTVKSTVTYILNANVENLQLIGNAKGGATGNELNNHLDGNSAFNVLQGLAGKDRLDGHGGNDLLIGGSEADVFVFGTGYAADAILDFEKGVDRIDLRGWDAISDFADFKSHAVDTGANIELHVGKDRLVIEKVDMVDLHASDFIF